MQLTNETIEQILKECREAIQKIKLDKNETELFLQLTAQTLADYFKEFPEDTELEYNIRKRFGRIELEIRIPGEKKNIFEVGEHYEDRRIHRIINSMRMDAPQKLEYFYILDENILFIRTPRHVDHKTIMNAAVYMILGGIVLGYLCSLLPENINGFLVDDLAKPIGNVITKVMTGVSGPMIFLSVVNAISAVDDIDELNRLGSKLIVRFVLVTVGITAVSVVVGLVFFTLDKGRGDFEFSLSILIDLLIGIIPINIISPFIENDFPQLLMLGVVMGTALLLLGKKDSVLQKLLFDAQDWINQLMYIVLKATPVITFLTFFNLFAQRDFDVFIKGWKYIVLTYVCYVLAGILKMVHVHLHCRKLNFACLLSSITPVVKKSFITAREMGIVNDFNDTVEEKIGISHKFSSLWFPLNQTVLTPKGPVTLILSAFFAAQLTGTPVSVEFVFILFLLTVQISLAYPGSVAANTIIFTALGLPLEYVGMFSAYGLATKNASIGFNTLMRFLEITEAAYKTDCIDLDKQNTAGQIAVTDQVVS